MSENKFSNLIRKEDWLAVWIGVIVIALGATAVLTGWFDFSALKAGINKVEINQKQTPKTVKWIEIDINPI